jgi:hypothetical protein
MKLSLILFYGMNLLEMKIICFDGVVLQSGILYGNAAFYSRVWFISYLQV